jgi:hypothetical protein
VTKHIPIYFFASLYILVGFSSCKKINEATELGGDLIPAVDNVNTFEVSLNTETDNRQFNDTTKVFYSDVLAAGDLNDPEFGTTHANYYFNILPATLGTNPFLGKDTVSIIDSVVLSLDYQGGYGDTTGGVQTLRVFEIAQNSGFSKDSLYKYADPKSEFATTGAELGSKTFTINSLKDSLTIIRPRDTSRVANVVRIKLDNSLGTRFSKYDTTSNTASGGYHNDSTNGGIFRSLFAGLAIKADNSGNVLTYYNLANTAKTKLTVYYQIVHGNGTRDTLSTNYYHSTNGQANYVKMVPGVNWASYLNNGAASDDKVYLQSSPSGSYASILIPGLDTLKNKVIHRAELILTKVSSTSDNIFTAPTQLFLDRKNSEAPDTLNLLYRDLVPLSSGTSLSFDYSSFGGNLKYNTYTFNITRFVQGVVTRHEPVDTLRLYAPYRAMSIYAPAFVSFGYPGGKANVPVAKAIANGRVVLGGGGYANPEQRLRLRIIYSNL